MNNFEDFEEDTEIKKKPINLRNELRRDLRHLISLDMYVLDDIKIYKDMFEIENIDKLNEEQLQDLLAFCTNNRITREKNNK